jgi:hypothetical protein
MTVYVFDTQLTEGEEAESALDDYFGAQFHVYTVGMDAQRRGIDRIFVSPHQAAHKRLRVQYKADRTASRTGNFFCETISVSSSGAPGWVITSESDYLIYYLPLNGYAYALRMSALRFNLPRWYHAYPSRQIPNEGYYSHGILVPLEALAKLCQLGQGKVLSGLPTFET